MRRRADGSSEYGRVPPVRPCDPTGRSEAAGAELSGADRDRFNSAPPCSVHRRTGRLPR